MIQYVVPEVTMIQYVIPEATMIQYVIPEVTMTQYVIPEVTMIQYVIPEVTMIQYVIPEVTLTRRCCNTLRLTLVLVANKFLLSVGVDQKTLEDLGRTFEPYKAAGIPSQPAVYYGGEIRENSGGDLSYVAVACGGPSQASGDLLPAEVLKHILGVGPHIKYSLGTASSVLSKAVVQATDSPFAVSGFTANYSDAGLFGFTVVSPTQSIDKVLRAASKELKSLLSSGVSDAQVKSAKTRLKAEICMNFENPENILSWLGEQTLHSDSIVTPHEVYKLVDNITTADVNKVAKALSVSKPSMGVAGNTSNVPYLDKLFSWTYPETCFVFLMYIFSELFFLFYLVKFLILLGLLKEYKLKIFFIKRCINILRHIQYGLISLNV
ncbi:Cytochrome b-c1 complex subunit 2, mitochondrial [Bulinus truncatus]|nr:Cytochrome b-c1 complex subunit 2, mitochondrial [Bulinus truncatus]